MVQVESSTGTIFEQALNLAPSDRAELAHLLIDSLTVDAEEKEPGFDEYWEAELRRQNEEIRNGTADLVPLDEARAEMFRPLT